MNVMLLKEQQSSVDRNYENSLRQKLSQLEGQCRIKEIVTLKINYFKGIVLTLLLTISVVGLFLLKYFKTMRAFVFFDKLTPNQTQKITHIFIKGHQSEAEISKVQKMQYQNETRSIFQFKKLRYQLYNQKWIPLGLNFTKTYINSKSEKYMKQGLSNEDVANRLNLYGRNEHKVEVPTYPQFIFDTMTQPFFLFQYFVSLIYALENVMLFSILMIVFGFITTTVNYFLLRNSYNKIKQTAQKLFRVTVLRETKLIQIDNVDLVPGDLYIPCHQIPCDSIVVSGNLFVDEVSLTGENVPIAKFALVNQESVYDKTHWLYQGATLETMKQNTWALAVNVGYGSRRGRIIRKILTKVSKQPQFFMKIIYFQIQVLIVSIIIYLATLPNLLTLDIDVFMVIFRLCDFVTYSFPAPFPILFNLAYGFCLVRLSKQNIVGTQAEKTVEGSRLKTLCFDKTGTLTQNTMEVAKVYHFQSETKVTEVTNSVNEITNVLDCFASCNSVELINGQVKGDEIDLRLFHFVNASLHESRSRDVVREIRVNGRTLEILKIHQYESQFQSMSVMLKDTQSERYFIYVKGSPEMIHNYSKLKFQGFDDFIKKLSFSGFRSIGFGFKEIGVDEVRMYSDANREQFLRNTSISGVVTFVNKLKQDATSTLSALSEAGIITKIITGDNIYLGIQTAFATGIIDSDKQVIVIEGSKYNEGDNSVDVIELSRKENGEISERRNRINNFEYSQNQDTVYAIDNDFISKKTGNFLSDRVKVFARISPQNKALIVRKHKQRELQIVNSRKGIDKLLGDCSFKVGMVGDGANDLIAIKEADLGIGISSSDAIYSASFAIKDLSQIIEIVLQSKNVQRQIYQMAKYYGITQFISIIVTIIIAFDSSYFTSMELIYKNFVNTLLITLFFGMTKPATKLTRYIPNSNFLDLQNHLVYWGNLLICSIGFIISYIYYSNSDDFVPNTNTKIKFPQGWFGQTKSSTINFITNNIVYTFLPIFIYQSKPWKQPIWTNKPLFILILINIVLIVIISFSTSHLSSLTLQPIALKEVTIVIIIMAITCGVLAINNIFLQKLFFNRRYKSYSLQNSKELVSQQL